MKRTTQWVLIAGLLVSLSVLAHKGFQPKTWQFYPPDGAPITINIDRSGNLTAYQGELLLGERKKTCDVIE